MISVERRRLVEDTEAGLEVVRIYTGHPDTIGRRRDLPQLGSPWPYEPDFSDIACAAASRSSAMSLAAAKV